MGKSVVCHLNTELPGTQRLVPSTIAAQEPRPFWRSIYQQHNRLQSQLMFLEQVSSLWSSCPSGLTLYLGHYFTGRDRFYCYILIPKRKGRGIIWVPKHILDHHAPQPLLPLWPTSVLRSPSSLPGEIRGPPALLKTNRERSSPFLSLSTSSTGLISSTIFMGVNGTWASSNRFITDTTGRPATNVTILELCSSTKQTLVFCGKNKNIPFSIFWLK